MNSNVIVNGGQIAVLLASIIYFYKENEDLKKKVINLENEISYVAKYVKLLEVKHSKVLSHILTSSNQEIPLEQGEEYEESFEEYEESEEEPEVQHAPEPPKEETAFEKAKRLIREREAELENR